MEKDQTAPGRRSVLRATAFATLAATAGLLVTESLRSPSPDAGGGTGAGAGSGAGTGSAGVPGAAPDGIAHGGAARSTGSGAAGPPAAQAAARSTGVRGTAYRLQPMTEYTPTAARRALPPVRRHPFLSLPETGRTMVLTFDDGPDPHYTPRILNTLRRYDVRAMFFVCGEMVEQYPDLLREIADGGHVVGNHTWSHPLIPRLSRSGVRGELGSTSTIVEQVLGAPPLWYRAPFGAWNRHSFEIGASLGMEPLGWTLDTLDWMEPGAGAIVSRVLAGAGPGVVVLNHDAGGDRSQSVVALRNYLPKLLADGYTLTVPRR
ncbi:polysaccharide deacetylase family protein [Streptomyces sp. NPDC057638]|uniref:polysaccharide deacetylase family protein n=1 Tax=Streptomyces sp. NPDC057638 TaxID=3346190 RepID=UPI0036A1B736